MSGKPENLTTQFEIYEKADPSKDDQLDIQFAQNLVKQDGNFFYCEDKKDCIEQLNKLKEEKEWNYIHSWEEDLRTSLHEAGFQRNLLGYHLDNSNAAISNCECLIAETGAILMAPKQAARRRLPMFPAAHIIIAEPRQLFSNLEEAVEYFLAKNKDELPSVLDLSKDTGWKTSINNFPVLYADGPRNIFVFLCDESFH